jgi:hypothetical protein
LLEKKFFRYHLRYCPPSPLPFTSPSSIVITKSKLSEGSVMMNDNSDDQLAPSPVAMFTAFDGIDGHEIDAATFNPGPLPSSFVASMTTTEEWISQHSARLSALGTHLPHYRCFRSLNLP